MPLPAIPQPSHLSSSAHGRTLRSSTSEQLSSATLLVAATHHSPAPSTTLLEVISGQASLTARAISANTERTIPLLDSIQLATPLDGTAHRSTSLHCSTRRQLTAAHCGSYHYSSAHPLISEQFSTAWHIDSSQNTTRGPLTSGPAISATTDRSKASHISKAPHNFALRLTSRRHHIPFRITSRSHYRSAQVGTLLAAHTSQLTPHHFLHLRT